MLILNLIMSCFFVRLILRNLYNTHRISNVGLGRVVGTLRVPYTSEQVTARGACLLLYNVYFLFYRNFKNLSMHSCCFLELFSFTRHVYISEVKTPLDARTCSGPARPFPNKNVIQGMDLVYSQTKSGHPLTNYWKTKELWLFFLGSLSGL